MAAARAGEALSWSDPYLDLLGQGRLITCNRALFDAEGGLLGVASLDLSLDAVVRRDLGPGEGVRRASLLDAAGRVVAETGDADADAPGESGQELELRPYAHAAVVDGVRGGASTGLVTAPDGSLVAWQRLAPLPWTLAIEVAPD
ncbi:MAG: PDC sensor domain-containing protein [Planctomycetota bacterium]